MRSRTPPYIHTIIGEVEGSGPARLGNVRTSTSTTTATRSHPSDPHPQDAHLAVDGATDREPQALDPDDRTWLPTMADPLVNRQGAQAAALRQGAADQRPRRVDTPRPTTPPGACSTAARRTVSPSTESWIAMAATCTSGPATDPDRPQLCDRPKCVSLPNSTW